MYSNAEHKEQHKFMRVDDVKARLVYDDKKWFVACEFTVTSNAFRYWDYVCSNYCNRPRVYKKKIALPNDLLNMGIDNVLKLPDLEQRLVALVEQHAYETKPHVSCIRDSNNTFYVGDVVSIVDDSQFNGCRGVVVGKVDDEDVYFVHINHSVDPNICKIRFDTSEIQLIHRPDLGVWVEELGQEGEERS